MYQRIAEIMGKDGCYMFALIYVAERDTGKHFNPLEIYRECMAKGMIKPDCFVIDPAGLLNMLTGKRWAVMKEIAAYETRKDQVEILRYEYTNGRSTIGHFVVGNGMGKVEYDPYSNSNTVSKGKLVSKRIFWKM